jgi:hypothetical protein
MNIEKGPLPVLMMDYWLVMKLFMAQEFIGTFQKTQQC